MADMTISPSRYRTVVRQAKQQDQKTDAKKTPAQGQAHAARPMPSRMDRQQLGQTVMSQLEAWLERDETCKNLLDWMTPKKRRLSQDEIDTRTREIRSKLRAGARLSTEDRNFLAQHAPVELAKMETAQRMRDSLRAQVQCCKTREQATQKYASAGLQADNVDPKDPDLSSVIRGQLAAAMREAGPKPAAAQLEQSRQLQQGMPERRERHQEMQARREALLRHYQQVGREEEEKARRRCEARG